MRTVLFGDLFDVWLDEQEDGLQEKVLADLINLRTYDPALSRHYADTVKGSHYKNMQRTPRTVWWYTGQSILCI